MKRFLVLAAASAVAVLGSSSAANAQTATPSGFSVNHFEPSERGSEWFVMDSLDLQGNLRPALGVVGEYAYRPLVLTDSNGDVKTSIVREQFFLHPGASLVLFDRLRVAFDLPVLLHDDGHTAFVNGAVLSPPAHETGIGDLRLGADLRLFGVHGDAITGAFGVQVSLPTGSKDDYSGDGSVRVLPRFQIAGDISYFTYAAKIGIDIRAHDDYDNGQVGSNLFGGASAGLRILDRKLVIGPEIFGQSVLSNGPFFAKKSSPVEGLIGTHYTIGDSVRIGAGVGTGLSVGYGSPESRVMASLEWAPPAKTSDRDQDGIKDADDACPDTPGVHTDDPKTNGCPPAALDRDKDGIVDGVDACPDVPGVATDDPKTNGCPPDRDGDGVLDAVDACPDVAGMKTDDPKTNGCPADRDHDGVLDAVDACPDTAGVATSDPKTNGCPADPDRDKDGILNADDACPDEAGPANKDPKRNGCPKAFVRDGQINILEEVKFKTGSAAIVKGPDSEAVLAAVAEVLTKHQEIKTIDVQGFTDNRGNAASNKKLSAARAASVVAWLSAHGIDKSRMTSQGFGQDNPRDTNGTDAGRQNNRRVEFHIVGGSDTVKAQ